jgi:hypothetical protein
MNRNHSEYGLWLNEVAVAKVGWASVTNMKPLGVLLTMISFQL